MQYNTLDRLVSVAYNGHSPTRSTYDDDGNVLTLEDTTGTTSFTYDALNRLTVKKLPDGTTLTYGYDKVGNLTSYNDAGGTVTYGYNEVNLLTSLTEPSGAKTTYGYDNANRRTSMTLPSSTGITVTYGYDNAGHTLSIKALRGTTQLLYLTYTYTKTLKTKATYNDDTSLNYIYGYTYDALNRLTVATGLRGTSTSYGYDGAGNRTSSVSHGITTTYSYNAADELVSSLTNGTTTNYTYDGNGNQVTGAGRTFSINEKNQIIGVSVGSSNDSYSYSGLDQTDRVQVNGASAIYSSLGLSVDGAGSSSATYYTRTNQGQLVNERTTSGTYYYLMDDLGSVLKVVDSSGTVKNSYYYDPYGNSLNKNETITNPWQYGSGYYDANTGLDKFGTRYYDPQMGRWTQRDPKSLDNPYGYVGDEPKRIMMVMSRQEQIGFHDSSSAPVMKTYHINPPLSCQIYPAMPKCDSPLRKGNVDTCRTMKREYSTLHRRHKHYMTAHSQLSSVLAQKPLGLVFDIDGTLSPIAPTPQDAYLYPGVAAMLEQLREHAHVAIMTGRGISDGAGIVNVDDITYIGTHGLEWSDGLPATHEIRLIPGATRYVELGTQLLDLVQRHLDDLPGVIVQRKAVGGTLHYRGAANPEQAREKLLALLTEPTHQLGMRLGEGKMVVEVLTPLMVNKGQALRSYAQRFEMRGLVFAGDDRTDLDAVFEAERLRAEGIATLAIVVRHGDTLPELLAHADLIVDGVEGMVKMLQEITNKVK